MIQSHSMRTRDTDPMYGSALKQLPEDGVIIYGDDFIAVRTYGPNYNHHWSGVAMDSAVETAARINDNDSQIRATTTVQDYKDRTGTEVIITLHKI